jgi:hypothetical protein
MTDQAVKSLSWEDCKTELIGKTLIDREHQYYYIFDHERITVVPISRMPTLEIITPPTVTRPQTQTIKQASPSEQQRYDELRRKLGKVTRDASKCQTAEEHELRKLHNKLKTRANRAKKTLSSSVSLPRNVVSNSFSASVPTPVSISSPVSVTNVSPNTSPRLVIIESPSATAVPPTPVRLDLVQQQYANIWGSPPSIFPLPGADTEIAIAQPGLFDIREMLNDTGKNGEPDPNTKPGNYRDPTKLVVLTEKEVDETERLLRKPSLILSELDWLRDIHVKLAGYYAEDENGDKIPLSLKEQNFMKALASKVF